MHRILTFMAVMAVAAVASAVSSRAQPIPPLTLAYSDEDLFPFQTGAGTIPLSRPGVAVELIRIAAGDAGVPLVLKRMPGKRVLAEIESGALDGGFLFSFMAERASAMVFPMRDGAPDSARRVTTLNYVLYRRTGTSLSFDGTKITGLSGAIGINNGFSIGEELRRLGATVSEAQTTEQNVRKLESGRIGGYAMHDAIADPFIAANRIRGLEKLPTPLLRKDYFLVFSRRFAEAQPGLAERLWDGVSRLRELELAGLMSKYRD